MKTWIFLNDLLQEVEVEGKNGIYYYKGINVPIFFGPKDALEDKIVKLETRLVILKAENERVKLIEQD